VRRFAFAVAGRDESETPCNATKRKRPSERGAHRQRSSDAWNDFACNAGDTKRAQLFVGAAENRWITALQADDHAVRARRIDQPLVDEMLHGRLPAATFPHGNFFRAQGQAHDLRTDEGVVKDDVGRFEEAQCAEREQVDGAGSCAHEIDRALWPRRRPQRGGEHR